MIFEHGMFKHVALTANTELCSLFAKDIYIHDIRTWNVKNILFSGHSCVRKMCHLLLAGYEDAPSFLNQWQLKVYTEIFPYTTAQLRTDYIFAWLHMT